MWLRETPGRMPSGRHLRLHDQCATMCMDRLDLAFEELGSLNLKNIARPVEAFVVHIQPTDPG